MLEISSLSHSATLSHPGASGYSGIWILGLNQITMKRTATEAFVPPAQEAFAQVSSYLTVYVALNPTQFAQLQADQPTLPDPYSERFGLRADPLKAAERAHYFTSWAPSPDTAPEVVHIKKFMICKMCPKRCLVGFFVESKRFWHYE